MTPSGIWNENTTDLVEKFFKRREPFAINAIGLHALIFLPSLLGHVGILSGITIRRKSLSQDPTFVRTQQLGKYGLKPDTLIKLIAHPDRTQAHCAPV